MIAMRAAFLTLAACACAAAVAQPPPPPSPLHGCLPPHDGLPFCDSTLPAAKRAALLAANLTVGELVGMMQGDAPAIDRLGVPGYHYGYAPCPSTHMPG